MPTRIQCVSYAGIGFSFIVVGLHENIAMSEAVWQAHEIMCGLQQCSGSRRLVPCSRNGESFLCVENDIHMFRNPIEFFEEVQTDFDGRVGKMQIIGVGEGREYDLHAFVDNRFSDPGISDMLAVSDLCINESVTDQQSCDQERNNFQGFVEEVGVGLQGDVTE